jgi:phosphatidylglycerophosphate synthase
MEVTMHDAAESSVAWTRAPVPGSPARVLTSILAPLEKRVLLWLAARMPRRIHSDHLTGLAFAAMAAAGAGFWWSSVTPAGLLLVVICLAINWFGDSLDGTLARVRKQERPRYGFYVDHVVDLAGSGLLLGGLALSGYMTPLVAVLLLAAYFVVSAEAYLAAHSLGRFRMSLFGVGPTELRILLAIGTLALAVHPSAELFGRSFKLFDVGGVMGVAGLSVAFLVSAWSNARELARAEPRPAKVAAR